MPSENWQPPTYDSVNRVTLIRVESHDGIDRVVDYFTEDSIHVARITEWCGMSEEPASKHDLRPAPCPLFKGHLGAHGYEDNIAHVWEGTSTRYRRKFGR